MGKLKKIQGVWDELVGMLEAVADARHAFAELDRDGSDDMCLAEMAAAVRVSQPKDIDSNAAVGDLAQELFAAIDVNGDGKISLEEFQSHV